MKKRSILCFYTILLLSSSFGSIASAQVGGQFGSQQGGQINRTTQSNTIRSGDYSGPPRNKEEEMALYRQKDTTKVDTFALFNRAFIGVDIFEPIATALGQTYWSSGVVLQADLKGRLMPTIELGIGQSDRTMNSGEQYKSSQGAYGRIGLDFKALGNPPIGSINVGFRLGYSSFTYDIYNVKIHDPYWNESYTTNILNQNGTAIFMQLVAGARAKVGGSFYMGWSARYGFLINSTRTDYAKPFHIPGYGSTNGASQLMFSYYLLFKLPFKESAKPQPKK